MRFAIPQNTLARLRTESRMRTTHDEVTAAHDAYLLDPGMGPAAYLTTDGRVLIDGRHWDETDVREATDDEAIAAIVVGAKKTGINELIDLLPSPPQQSTACELCGGSRWITAGKDVLTGEPGRIICYECSGRGWRHTAARSV
jgi:hypothetical protein